MRTPLPVSNTDTVVLPSWSIAEVTGVTDGVLSVRRPASDDIDDVVIIGETQVEPSGQGVAYNEYPIKVRYDQNDGTPAHGETWGVASGNSLLKKDNTGFVILGGAQGGSVVVRRNDINAAGGGGGSTTWKEDGSTQGTGSILDVLTANGLDLSFSGSTATLAAVLATESVAGTVSTATSQNFFGSKYFTYNGGIQIGWANTSGDIGTRDVTSRMLHTSSDVSDFNIVVTHDVGNDWAVLGVNVDALNARATLDITSNQSAAAFSVDGLRGVTGTSGGGDTVTGGIITTLGSGGGSGVTSVDTGDGLTGGPITTTGTIDLDFGSMTEIDVAFDDALAIYDQDGSTHGKVTLQRVGGFFARVAEGRLTTESGVGVSSSDRSSQSTIYYTPYTGDRISLWDGTRWVLHEFAELSLALTGLTASKMYDIFAFHSGSVQLETSAAWTNNTTRADAVTRKNGVWVKSSDNTRRLIGSFWARTATTTHDRLQNRDICNIDNTVQRQMFKSEGTSHTYGTASWRAWRNNSSLINTTCVCSNPEGGMCLKGAKAILRPGAAGAEILIGIGIHTTTSSFTHTGDSGVSGSRPTVSRTANVTTGITAFYLNEYGNATSGTFDDGELWGWAAV